jgi:hypothetical protein
MMPSFRTVEINRLSKKAGFPSHLYGNAFRTSGRTWWFSREVLALIIEKRVRRTRSLAEGQRTIRKPSAQAFLVVLTQSQAIGGSIMSKKIKIKSAPGNQSGWTDGTDDLVDKGVYFEQTSTAGQFDLYAPSSAQPPGPHTKITGPVQSGTNFSFTWQDNSWSITDFLISESNGTASGQWTATPLQVADAVPSGDGGDPESGTFQANDTVTVEGESSASAYA